MGGYLPWLGAACSGSTASLPSRSDSKQKAAQGTSCSCQPVGSRRLFNQSASEPPPGLGGLLPECSPPSTVLRRGFSLPSKRQTQVQPLDPFCMEAPCAPRDVHSFIKEKLRPLVISRPAAWAEQEEKHEADGGGETGGDDGERVDEGGESDNDSIASEEWAEALWSPGRQSQPIKRQEFNEGRARSILSHGQRGT